MTTILTCDRSTAAESGIEGLSWMLDHLDQLNSEDALYLHSLSYFFERHPDRRALPLLQRLRSDSGSISSEGIRASLDRGISACAARVE